MSEEPSDLGEMYSSSMQFAEMIWSYYQSLKAAGFTQHEALFLTAEYQKSFVDQAGTP